MLKLPEGTISLHSDFGRSTSNISERLNLLSWFLTLKKSLPIPQILRSCVLHSTLHAQNLDFIREDLELLLKTRQRSTDGLLMVYWWSTALACFGIGCYTSIPMYIYIYPRKMTPQNTSTGWRFRQPGDHIWLISPPQKNRAWPSSRRVVDPTSGCESSERAGQKPPKGFKTMRFINWAEPPKKKR